MVELTEQPIELFDLDMWHPDVIVIHPRDPEHDGWGFLERESDRGWFVKGHHSTKPDLFPCRTREDIAKILKILEDNGEHNDYLYALPWIDDLHPEIEARVFFVDSKVRWIRPAVAEGWAPTLEEAVTHIHPLMPRCCADVYRHTDGRLRIIEYNPFDCDTDLYDLDYWDVCDGRYQFP